MALLCAEDIKHDKNYKSNKNTVEKYYLNAPYKHYLNYKRLHIDGQHDLVMNMIYPVGANYYYSDYGSGYETDDTHKIIIGEVVVNFRNIDYYIEYYTKGYGGLRKDLVIVYSKMPYKSTKIKTTTNDNKTKWKYDIQYKTAVYISDETYHNMLPVQKPKFAIDKRLVKYLLTIKREEYGDFHRRVCNACLNVLNED